jgi:glucokinase
MKKYAIGADIGGSHISCAAIDLEKKEIIKSSAAYEPVDNQAAAEVILNSWAKALKKSIGGIDARELAGIGFAMPGPFEYATGIAMFTDAVQKFQSLHKVNVTERLKALLDLGAGTDYDCRYMNDATAFAVGEAWLGKARGAERSVSITLGTGFGSAFVDGGIPVVERADVPKMGCVWHLPYKGGIADDSFSTRWFVKRYAEKTGGAVSGAKDVADKVAAGDAAAREIFDEFGAGIGDFLGPVLAKFGAGVLVIGGNVAGAYNLFGGALEGSFKAQGLSVSVQISELKEDAALIGSARLFDEAFWARVKPLLPGM